MTKAEFKNAMRSLPLLREYEKELEQLQFFGTHTNEQERITELERKIEFLKSERAKIENCIDKLKDYNERLTLMLRYLKGKSWKEISDHTGYSRSRLSVIHKNALEHIKNVQ